MVNCLICFTKSKFERKKKQVLFIYFSLLKGPTVCGVLLIDCVVFFIFCYIYNWSFEFIEESVKKDVIDESVFCSQINFLIV